jgi:anti-anti-sigma factor
VTDIRVWRRRSGRVTVVAPSGELDISTSTALRRALRQAAEGSRLVLLDLHDVTFLDSTILGLCVTFVKRCGRSGITFMVTNASGVPLRAITLTGLSYLLPGDERQPPELRAFPMAN